MVLVRHQRRVPNARHRTRNELRFFAFHASCPPSEQCFEWPVEKMLASRID